MYLYVYKAKDMKFRRKNNERVYKKVIKTQEDTIRIPIKYNDELKKIVRYDF